jgi:alpha-ribazole phosphatase
MHMKEPTIVWLVRHGLPEGMEGRCYGQTDVPLSAQGMQQASAIATQLATERLTHIYSSPLRRALDTARVIAEQHHAPVEILHGISEIHFGDFEGLRYEEIQMRYPATFQSWMEKPTETQFPKGEHFRDLRQRVLAALDLMLTRHQGCSIAIVSHSGVIRLLIAKALSIPDSEMFRLAQRYAALNRIDYFEHGAMVQLMNGAVSSGWSES